MTKKEEIYRINERIEKLFYLGELPYVTHKDLAMLLDATYRISEERISRYFYLLNLEDTLGLIHDKYILRLSSVQLVSKYGCSSNYINIKITKIFKYLITSENINYILKGGDKNELFVNLRLDYHDRCYLFYCGINTIEKLKFAIDKTNGKLRQFEQIGEKSEKKILAAMDEYYKRKRD